MGGADGGDGGGKGDGTSRLHNGDLLVLGYICAVCDCGLEIISGES